MSKQTFFQGTLILVGAGLITKILGFVNRIMLSRIIGAEGMGLYQMAVPTLYLVITLATFGLPIAISKLVSEAEAQHNKQKLRATLRISLIIVTVLSILFTTGMIVGAPLISKYLLTDQRAYYSLISIAPIVPIVAVSSILRGYFQGRQNMIPTASSQLVEQSVRIFTVIILASLLLPYGVEFAAAGAMVGIVIGEFSGMIVLLHHFRKAKVKQMIRRAKAVKTFVRHMDTIRDLFRIAVPVTASRLIGSLTYAVEPVIVAQSLALAGLTTQAATAQYGLLAGMAIPLLTFPTFFTYSLSVSLVPAIAEAAAQKNRRLIQRRLYQSLRVSLIVGAPCTVLLYVFADPLCLAIYGNEELGGMLRIMAPLFLLHYFQGPLAAALQGLDHAQAAMRNSIIGAVLKTAAIFVLASQPQFGIDGVAMSINISVVLVTLLHFFSINKLVGFTMDLRESAKVGIAMFVAGYGSLYLYRLLHGSENEGLSLLTALLFATVFYLVLLFLFRVLGRQDIGRIPWIGPRIAPYFPKR